MSTQESEVKDLTTTIRTNLGLKCSRSKVRGGAWNMLAMLAGYGDVEWMPRSVVTAMYGIDYARRTGRLPGTANIAIRELSDWQLCELVAEVAVACKVPGEAPQFLIKKFCESR